MASHFCLMLWSEHFMLNVVWVEDGRSQLSCCSPAACPALQTSRFCPPWAVLENSGAPCQLFRSYLLQLLPRPALAPSHPQWVEVRQSLIPQTFGEYTWNSRMTHISRNNGYIILKEQIIPSSFSAFYKGFPYRTESCGSYTCSCCHLREERRTLYMQLHVALTCKDCDLRKGEQLVVWALGPASEGWVLNHR